MQMAAKSNHTNDFACQLQFAPGFPDSQRAGATALAKEYHDVLVSDGLGRQLLVEDGLCVSADNCKGGILVTGINPSGKTKQNFCYSFRAEMQKEQKEQKETKGYLHDKYEEFVKGHDELLPLFSYLDLFPLHEGNQAAFMQSVNASLSLQARIIAVTQREIERLRPRLIIHANAQTAYYWGLSPHSTWLGYNLLPVASAELPDRLGDMCGRIYRIAGPTGFKTDHERVNAEVYVKSSLIGSIFVRHGLYNRPRHAPFRLTSDKVWALFELASRLDTEK